MKGLTGILFKLVGGPLYLPVVWKTSRPVEVAKLSVTGIHLITCLTARSFQFMSALLKYSQLMQNNGKDALTKIKDSKINLACNICDTICYSDLVWGATLWMRRHFKRKSCIIFLREMFSPD